MRSAAAAVGALRSVLCNFALEGDIRGKVYSVLVLAALLYGSEMWCLRGGLLAKLRRSHNRFCRAMSRVNMVQTPHGITSHRISYAGAS